MNLLLHLAPFVLVSVREDFPAFGAKPLLLKFLYLFSNDLKTLVTDKLNNARKSVARIPEVLGFVKTGQEMMNFAVQPLAIPKSRQLNQLFPSWPESSDLLVRVIQRFTATKW